MENTNLQITPEIIKQCKNLVCDCGGILFKEGLIFKKLSQFISPSGKEEIFPINVIICQKCGKVPTEFNIKNMLPEEILAEKTILLDFKFPKPKI
jgi:hypothetical protein